MLCYDMSSDAIDEYCRTSDSTAMESLKRFCVAIRAVYEGYYLRQPTRRILTDIYASMRTEGFLVCLVH